MPTEVEALIRRERELRADVQRLRARVRRLQALPATPSGDAPAWRRALATEPAAHRWVQSAPFTDPGTVLLEVMHRVTGLVGALHTTEDVVEWRSLQTHPLRVRLERHEHAYRLHVSGTLDWATDLRRMAGALLGTTVLSAGFVVLANWLREWLFTPFGLTAGALLLVGGFAFGAWRAFRGSVAVLREITDAVGLQLEPAARAGGDHEVG